MRKILDIIQIAENEQRKGVIVSLDYKKCFDTIDHKVIFGALEYFGFGDNFLNMIKTTYKQFSTCIQSNGYFLNYFPVTCSVHQGRPNSSFFFRWFKFTLKPPYTVAIGNLFLAIWDTSHWNFFCQIWTQDSL